MEDERLLLSEPGAGAGGDRRDGGRGRRHRPHPRALESTSRRGARDAPAPAGFDPANHRSHRYDWETLDQAVNLTRAAGMRVMLSVTGPGPLWTSRSPRKHNPRYKPSPSLFGSSRARWRRATATASTAT